MRVARLPMRFSLMFFSTEAARSTEERYALLREAAQFGDSHQFTAIWTPERHFNPFGGLFPNPSVISAALAAWTRDIQIRAGSVILPLHDPLRVAEEWSVVDNLSDGRVSISFGSGWNANDFVLSPQAYEERRSSFVRQIQEVRHLWRGGSVTRRNGRAQEVEVRIYPPPVQPELTVWVTSSGNVETFATAGELGANVLTHLVGQDVVALREKIHVYRQKRIDHGHDPDRGCVTLMLHTFIGDDQDEILSLVRNPLRGYLLSALNLEQEAARGGGDVSGGRTMPPTEIPDDLVEELLDDAFQRFVSNGSLIGTLSSCEAMVEKARAAGVGEIACLIDFGVAKEHVVAALDLINELRRRVSADSAVR